ncbi:MAG: hypothetical protein EPN47_12335 [Acidobacteria bacterium]|nr:MAG: hypothetical protein EPN47_12335 [Acidobacteriota bacterium]
MTKSKPPALAAWMLEHMQWGGRNEALAGDLLEEFQRRRSASWYWRQVMGALVASVAGELRQHWKLLGLEAVLVLVWTYYSLLFLRFTQERFWALAFEPHGRSLYWVLVRCSGIVALVLPLTVYLAVKRFTNFLPALCGLCAGIVVCWGLGLLSLALILPGGSNMVFRWPVILYSLLPVQAAGILPLAVSLPWWRLPLALLLQSVPLLFAIWTAQLWAKRRHSTSLQTNGEIG